MAYILRSAVLPRMTAPLVGLASALLLGGCFTQPAETAPAAAQESTQAATHPVSGLEVIPLSVTAQDGTVHRFMVEVARSPAEQARGLMFRTQMGDDEGMLFPRNPPGPASFWMKNTVLPLDIIFIGPDRRVLNVAADTVPYSKESVSSTGAAAAVLELNARRAAELGIGPGSQVSW
jgi:uncharacterized membrane protein (UPF0127 family)